MNRRLNYLPFLIIFLLGQSGFSPVSAYQTDWTEEDIGKAAVKAEKAASRKKWSLAIKYGEQMLLGSETIFGPDAPYSITRLKTLNRYYDKAGRLGQVSARVEKAYIQSRTHFIPSHDTAVTSRLLYYKLLIAQKKFKLAIPIVLENISLLSKSEDDTYKNLHYLGQLQGLYALTGHHAAREKTLVELLALNILLTSPSLKDNRTIIVDLAKTYCIQKKHQEFEKLMQKHDLKYVC